VTETNVFRLSQPGTCADPLTEVYLCRSADRGVAQRRAGVVGAGRRGRSCSLAQHACRKLTEDGRARLVRHGHLPEREIASILWVVGVPGYLMYLSVQNIELFTRLPRASAHASAFDRLQARQRWP
jgi:hypothetical protein